MASSLLGLSVLIRPRRVIHPTVLPLFCALLLACGDAPAASSGGEDGGKTSTGRDAGDSPEDAGAGKDMVRDDAGEGGGDSSASDVLYRRDRLLDVEITLAPTDWELIRNEGRSLGDVFSGCAFGKPFEYTKVAGTVTIDGHSFENIAVRKKGFIGSLATLKPGLRIDLAEYVEDQALLGQKVFTLNNSLTDLSMVRQCLAYDTFATLGNPAPRCAFARVRVNGEELGTYVHVEAVKKPLLRRAFGDDEGDLYEGQVGDFRADRLAYLEKKTHEDEPLSPEIMALTKALEKPDSELLAALEPLIDLDAFLPYWAAEAITNHEDSYSGNQNNYYVYVHSRTRKIAFLPWGTDGTFGVDSPIMIGRPQTVYATATLSRRLYGLPEVREKYRATLKRLLGEKWDAASLETELDKLVSLVGKASNEVDLKGVREFIRGRRAALEQELAKPARAWPFDERVVIDCDPKRKIPIKGRFKSSWNTSALSPSFAFENSLQVTLTAGPIAPTLILSNAGPDGAGRLAVGLVAFELDGRMAVVQLLTTRPTFEKGERHFHGFETFGVLLTSPSAEEKAKLEAQAAEHPDAAAPPVELILRGFISDGSIHFEEMGMKPGDVVSGTFEGIFTYNTTIAGGDE
jgi:hypothetical protein